MGELCVIGEVVVVVGDMGEISLNSRKRTSKKK